MRVEQGCLLTRGEGTTSPCLMMQGARLTRDWLGCEWTDDLLGLGSGGFHQRLAGSRWLLFGQTRVSALCLSQRACFPRDTSATDGRLGAHHGRHTAASLS